MKSWLKKTVAAAVLCTMTLGMAASASAAIVMKTTPSTFRSNLNTQLKNTKQKPFSSLSFSSTKTSGTSWALRSGSREYLKTENMTFSVNGKKDKASNISLIHMRTKPLCDADDAAYREEWTIAAIATLKAAFSRQKLSTDDAKSILGNDLGMPIDRTVLTDRLAQTQVVLTNAHRLERITIGGIDVEIEASIDKEGTFELYIGLDDSKFDPVKSATPTPSPTPTPISGTGVLLTSGNAQVLRVGDHFRIQLSANSGTGYAWQYSTSGAGASRLIASRVVENATNAGGRVTYEWEFEVTGKGVQYFAFALVRPWDTGTPAQIANFSICVDSPMYVNRTVLTENAVHTLRVGDRFVVRLSVNAGTGYVWSYATSGAATSRLIDTRYVEGATVPGGRQTIEWEFEVTGKGAQSLHFTLARPWESVGPIQSSLFSISVP